MSQYNSLKATIDANIYANHEGLIRGDILNSVLNQMVSTLGMGYQFVGIATPATNPGSPDAKVFYIANGKGVYANFAGIEINENNVVLLCYDTIWKKLPTGIVAKEEIERISNIVSNIIRTRPEININWSNNYYLFAIPGTSQGKIIWNTNYKTTDFIDISGNNRIAITTVHSDVSTQAGLCFYDANKVVINGYTYPYTEIKNAIAIVDVPANAKYVRTCILKDETYGGFEYYVFGDGTEIPDAISELRNDITESRTTESALFDAINAAEDRRQSEDISSIIMVDLMQLVHSTSGMTSVAYMTVISSSENSIVLSNSDAATFIDNNNPCVVGFANGTYKLVWMASASGTSINREEYDKTDLTNAITIQSLHDTVKGANGQHLSASGYLAMGQFVANEMTKRLSLKDGNYVGGLMFSMAETARGYQNTDEYNKVYDANGNVICVPIFNNWLWGGFTPNGHGLVNSRGVAVGTPSIGGWSQRTYGITQGNIGASIEFPISISGFGTLEIQIGGSMSRATSTGSARMEIYIDGILKYTESTIPKIQTRYVYDNVEIHKSLSIKIVLNEQEDTEISIYSIGFWSNQPRHRAAKLRSKTKIAVLGDSWTQFPGITGAIPNHPFNEIVERPDGTIGDGYGYFPKELSRITGVVVDNWGKSNMRSDNWGLEKIDTILSYTKYDYLIVEFFINDHNSGMSISNWQNNILEICDKCKRYGTRPILIMPCFTNSYSQSVSLGGWHESIIKGLNAYNF